jgi:hypothetical protein
MALPAKPKTAAERLEAFARAGSNIPLLKFNSGNWLIADVAVPEGTRFIAFPHQTAHMWTHFVDEKVIEEISAIIADDEDGDPEQHIVRGQGRADLGDRDETAWTTGKDGKPKDPWSFGVGLPLMNADTRTMVTFKTSSAGGRSAIADVVGNFSRNLHLGLPIFTLAASTYKNRKFGGFTQVPVFRPAGFEKPRLRVVGSNAGELPKPVDMNDDIPF